jgi:hypothetical protein
LSGTLLAEVAPVRCDDEKQTAERERDTCHDRPSDGKLELRDLCRGEPDPGDQHQQEAGFREADPCVMRETGLACTSSGVWEAGNEVRASRRGSRMPAPSLIRVSVYVIAYAEERRAHTQLAI